MQGHPPYERKANVHPIYGALRPNATAPRGLVPVWPDPVPDRWTVAPHEGGLASMTIADEIRRLLEAKARALVGRQAGVLAALLHDNFVYVNAGGRTFDRAGYVETYCNSGRIVFTRQGIADLAVRQIDNVVVATLRIDDDLEIDGRAVSAQYQSLCLFTPSARRWLWAAGQTMKAGSA